MDPLTLTTGILALLRACSKITSVVSKIQDMRHAPALVQAVNNEISDLHLVVLHISDYFENAKSSESPIPVTDGPILDLCSSALDQARDKVREVETLINDKLLKTSKQKVVKVSRKGLLREQSHLVQLQADLQAARQRIANLFGHFGIRDISRVEVLLRDIHSNNLPMLLQGQTRIEQTLDRIMHQQLITSNADQQSLEDVGLHSSSSSDPSSVQISISRFKISAPRPKCICPRRSTSIHLHTFLGSLFLGYNAAPLLVHSPKNCPRHMYTELRLIYFFPTWFLKLAFSAHVLFDSLGTVTCSLSLCQVVPDDHTIWSLIHFGDLERIKELLKSGQIAINAQHMTGTNLLQVTSLPYIFH